jgi:predicted nucleotidyltransferase
VAPDPVVGPEVISSLRRSGAIFAFLHGSRARGTAGAGSDVDVAAWWPGGSPPAFEVDLPAGVDLIALNRAPLEIAGRISLEGVLLFDDDPPARVRWVADTRKIWLDERPRFERAHREFAEAVRRGR